MPNDLLWDKSFALEQAAGDEELLQEILVLFKNTALVDLNRLNLALANKDAPALVYAAHSLRGGAASLGLNVICQLAMRIEEDARQDSCAVGQEEVAALTELLRQAQELRLEE